MLWFPGTDGEVYGYPAYCHTDSLYREGGRDITFMIVVDGIAEKPEIPIHPGWEFTSDCWHPSQDVESSEEPGG